MDHGTDNSQSKVEQVEGSTENVTIKPPNPNVSVPNPAELGHDPESRMERGGGQRSDPDQPVAEGKDTGGISNRPLQEEQGLQQDLPPRGEEKGE
jgi:hypothetical protein